ncbi:aspartate aminotransferase family protein [Streptomyces capitiformicae]|uniref:Acetylornithine/acetyl-lysine aminotransferase n=1 Tax=Streptomyces capitiformicae TaxID=2014920 RepID=A0A918ZLF6_9ACTN|nr:aspartate aminotransferase family protein [Streptomyces capitiformicae]GHE57342.1 acetylornithine/acetyl-lysine aminotransferase [Streptomyces capitiformicae]
MSASTAVAALDRQQVLTTLGRHWNPTAALMLAATGRQLESHARGTEVFGEDGSRALDFAGSYGVFLVGHQNDAVRAAVLDALDTAPSLVPGTVHPATADLFGLLTEILPAGLDRFALGCSGAEISEIALRAAYLARPERRRIVIVEGGYHGKTLGALTVLGQREHRDDFAPADRDLVIVPPGDAGAVREAVAGRDVAAVFVEPVLGGAYLRVPPADFMPDVARACRQTGTLLVADEIQTGFGRTGRMFAIEHSGVVPDIMLLSKALTGGFVPVAVVAMSEEVLSDARRSPQWYPGVLDGTGGSALSVAAAAATIRVVRDQNLPERAETVGRALREGLHRAVREHPRHLVDAPGIGLMTGLRTRNPSVENLISMQMAARGIHLGHSLNEQMDQPVLRFYPPLTVSAAEIERVLVALDASLDWLDRRPAWLMRRITWLLRRQYRLPPTLVLKLMHSDLEVNW